MLMLHAGGWHAILLPDHGGAFARLDWEAESVLVPIALGKSPKGQQAGAFWMLPWVNRLRGGRMGEYGQFAVNRPQENAAIHGLGRDHRFMVTESAHDRAVLTQKLWQGPVRYVARMEVSLSDAGCRIGMTLTNAGDKPFPMGFGWHPWFPRLPGTTLRFGATTRFASDPQNFATDPGPSQGVSADLATEEGHDHAFAGWDSTSEIAWPGIATLRMAAEGAWARNVHLYVPKGRDLFCLEPVTHVTDVINRREFAEFGDMVLLAPRESIDGALVLTMTA